MEAYNESNPHDPSFRVWSWIDSEWTSSLWPDLFFVQQFFDQLECETVLAELKAASGSGAVVYGQETRGAIDERVRKTFRVQPAPQTVELVIQRLLDCKEAIENHFGVTLTECEEP